MLKLAQDENQGPEFHENEVLKFFRRMKTWGLSFMSATLGYQEGQAKVFISCVCTSDTIFIEGF